MDTREYKKPKYLVNAMRARFGRNISVIGVTATELGDFESKMRYKNAGIEEQPQMKGRTIVDVTYKTHINTDPRVVDPRKELREDQKPRDWYDVFQVKGTTSESTSSKNVYRLEQETSRGNSFQLSGNGKLSAGYFNQAGGSIGAGANFSRFKNETTKEANEDTLQQDLSESYELTETLAVPPKTKVRAKITTWAVTFVVPTTTEFKVDVGEYIYVTFQSRLQRCLPCRSYTVAKLFAEELFRSEDGYENDAEEIKFRRKGLVSYIAKEVEITKEIYPLVQ